MQTSAARLQGAFRRHGVSARDGPARRGRGAKEYPREAAAYELVRQVGKGAGGLARAPSRPSLQPPNPNPIYVPGAGTRSLKQFALLCKPRCARPAPMSSVVQLLVQRRDRDDEGAFDKQGQGCACKARQLSEKSNPSVAALCGELGSMGPCRVWKCADSALHRFRLAQSFSTLVRDLVGKGVRRAGLLGQVRGRRRGHQGAGAGRVDAQPGAWAPAEEP